MTLLSYLTASNFSLPEFQSLKTKVENL